MRRNQGFAEEVKIEKFVRHFDDVISIFLKIDYILIKLQDHNLANHVILDQQEVINS